MSRNAEPASRLLYRIEEAQEQLGGIGRTKIYELMNTGQLKTVKIGRRTFVAQSALAEYVSRLTEGDGTK
ncbi:MAG: helix-turn-helix domain-containing protein [Leifsonia sp.]